jgi:hypothetical protein
MVFAHCRNLHASRNVGLPGGAQTHCRQPVRKLLLYAGVALGS